jgi:ring-1,2-phenylacetyl-CoA epoxidase subunit PaaD
VAAVVEAGVRAAIAAVDDPEMPGVSVVDLGLLETLDVHPDGRVAVGLIPTFSGCPALAVITANVTAAVSAVEGVTSVQVDFLRAPVWTIDRVSERAEAALGERLGVAVERGGVARCPRCGSVTEQTSMFGPTRCRAVHVCSGCAEAVEVMR